MKTDTLIYAKIKSNIAVFVQERSKEAKKNLL